MERSATRGVGRPSRADVSERRARRGAIAWTRSVWSWRTGQDGQRPEGPCPSWRSRDADGHVAALLCPSWKFWCVRTQSAPRRRGRGHFEMYFLCALGGSVDSVFQPPTASGTALSRIPALRARFRATIALQTR